VIMALFFKDKDQVVDWDTLISDIQSEKVYNPYCKSQDYYSVFKTIIISMLHGKEIVLVDSDFSDSELETLTGQTTFSSFNVDLDPLDPPIVSKSQLIKGLNATGEHWKVTLYTSGTTGIPKKVTHSYNSITRFVKYSKQNRDSVWGYAYNPTHMAGLQVFLQALMNGNSMVNLFHLSTEDIYREIEENQITHISATPTFYRLLLPYHKSFPSMQRITSGGEKFNERMSSQIGEVFPNAKINNVYASTEAGTLFASDNNDFTVKPEFEGLVKIEENELIIHKSLLGESEMKVDEWYPTGDIIDLISRNPLKFRFVSRKNEMINVGGYKVDPNEVEEYIRMIPGIKAARVFAKHNSVIGNLICCELVSEDSQLSEPDIRAFLQSRLQEFKIPRMFTFREKISTTRTGKTKRS